MMEAQREGDVWVTLLWITLSLNMSSNKTLTWEGGARGELHMNDDNIRP
jgi:hypothetical protein